MYFVGYGLTSRFVLAYKKETNRVLRAVHFQFDTTYASIPDHSLTQSYQNLLKPIDLKHVKEVKFDSIPSLIHDSEILQIKLPLPHSSSSINIQFLNNNIINLPYVKSIPTRHNWRSILPDTMRSNFLIISLHDDEPITAAGIVEYIDYLKEHDVTEIDFKLVKKERTTQTDYEDLRASFKQVGPIVYKLSSRKAITSAIRPTPCKTFGDIIKSPYFSI